MTVNDIAYRRISYRSCYCLFVMRGCSVGWFLLPLSLGGVCLIFYLLSQLYFFLGIRSEGPIPDWLTGSRASAFRHFLFFSENGCKLFCFSNTYFEKQDEPASVFQNNRKCFGFKKPFLRAESPLAEICFLANSWLRCKLALKKHSQGSRIRENTFRAWNVYSLL